MKASEPLSSLAEAPIGSAMRIRLLRHPRSDVAARLRELGMVENAVVRCVLRGNGNIICEVRNTRIGMDNRLAGSIMVSVSTGEAEAA